LPQGHRSVSVSRHFLLQTPQCPRSVRKRFSRDQNPVAGLWRHTLGENSLYTLYYTIITLQTQRRPTKPYDNFKYDKARNFTRFTFLTNS